MATTSNLSIDNNNHKEKAYSINIHCANCAAKIERKINELSDVDNATISILTKQLTLTAKNPDELLPTIQKIADKIEPGTIISQLEENTSNYKEKIYLIKNLDCANCGAKIEKKLNELAEINSAQLTFATKKLKIVAQNPDALLPQINKIANSIENGVKIMMDLVINHASTSSEWFKKAQRGETGVDSEGNEFNYRNLFHFKYKGSKTHYYENQNGNYVKVEVNVEDSQDWVRDGESNYYYYAKFGSDMPEFNYDYQATRDFIVEMAKFYLGLGIDGFRMDAIKHIYMENETENSSSDVINYDTGNRSYWDEQKEEFVTESYDYSTNSTKNIIFWKEFSAKLKASYPNCFITGENLDGWDERVAPYYESMDSQLDFCNYYDIQNYLYANTGYTASMLANQVNDKNAVFKEYRSDFINTAFTSNHDLLRAINHINANKEGETGVEQNVVINGSAQQLNRAKIYAAITLLQPGISFIYYGDELGMSSNTTENELNHENHIDRYYRQSFKWDDESERPLINIGEVDNSYDSYNEKLDTLSEQQSDPNSVWSFYQDLCEIKARDDFPADGNMTAYSYNLNADTFYYVIEPSNSSQSRYRVWINTGGRSGNSGDVSYSLESGEEVIYKYNATDSSISPYGIVVAVM